MDLAVSTEELNGSVVITVGGEGDVYTAPLLRDTLEQRISAGDSRIIVDLDQVEFIDSTGLGVLVGRLKNVRNRSGSMVIVCTAERVLTVFKLTGLDKVFTITDSVGDALAALRL